MADDRPLLLIRVDYSSPKLQDGLNTDDPDKLLEWLEARGVVPERWERKSERKLKKARSSEAAGLFKG